MSEGGSDFTAESARYRVAGAGSSSEAAKILQIGQSDRDEGLPCPAPEPVHIGQVGSLRMDGAPMEPEPMSWPSVEASCTCGGISKGVETAISELIPNKLA